MAEFQKRWVTHLRNNARQEPSEPSLSCPLCDEDILPDIEAFRAHVRADEPKHPTLTGDADIVEAFRKMSIHPPNQSALSPSSSLAAAASPPTTPSRSRRRSGVAGEFDRGDAAKNVTGQRLWNPADEPKGRNSRAKASTSRRKRPRNRRSSTDQPAPVPFEVHPADMTELPDFKFLLQPPTRSISKDQLGQEIMGIEEGLRMVEKRCMELYSSSERKIEPNQELTVAQYQKLIGLHRTLLHEHHDFFLACQHPAANAAILKLPARYNMPARMWRYGIQSFLELLRIRLPHSREHMLAFICIAYSTMALLYETVHGFAPTWIECLGDLSRYRMAIADDDKDERETWTRVSQSWYTKASDLSPEVGRLYHHLAILARPNALQQLYYFNKSLCVPFIFPIARNSIMSLFKPVLARSITLDPCDSAFIRVHAILFTWSHVDQLEDSMGEFLGSLDKTIAKRNKEWLHQGIYTAISLICSLLGYGATTNTLKLSLPATERDEPPVPRFLPAAKNDVDKDTAKNDDKDTAEKKFETAKSFAMQTCSIVFWRKADINALPFFHTILVFLYYLAKHRNAMLLMEKEVPWSRVVGVLNAAYPVLISKARMEDEKFPRPPFNEPLRPLPEDYAMRGLELSKDYFPDDWFSSKKLEDDEKMFEPPSLGDERRQRLLWLGRRICSLGNWIEWDQDSELFTVNSAYDTDVNLSEET